MENYILYDVNHLKKYIKTLKNKEFDEFIYKVYIDGKSEILEKVFTNKKNKNRYLRVLDDCLARQKRGKPFGSNVEIEFIKKMAADDLPNLIKKEVQKFSINIIRRGFYVYYYGIVDELNQLYISESREVFEQRARDVLKGPDNGFSYKSKFIDIFANDPQYGLYWAKFLNIKRAKLPDFVQELIEKPKKEKKARSRKTEKPKKEKSSEKSKIATSKVPNASPPEPKPIILLADCTERQIIVGKEYKVFTITTSEQFCQLVHCFLHDLRFKYIGIDCEMDQENNVVLIQVAVEFLQRWIALIDVQALPKDLPEWKKFFEHLFGNTTDSVWFAFETDFACLCKTFPFLSSMFSYYAKVICLKKFVEEILQNPKAKEAVFANQKLESLSLAHIAETFTGISLKKELQQSDWAKRPLTDEQKLYAATDAAILLEIVEKIEELLRKNLEYIERLGLEQKRCFYIRNNTTNVATVTSTYLSTTSNNLQNMQINNTQDQKSDSKCKNCSASKLAIIPSSLYILIHKLVMIHKLNIDNEDDWNALKNDAINVKNKKFADFGGFPFKVKFGTTQKPSKMLIFDCKDYQIRPLTSQVLTKLNNHLCTFKLSNTVLENSKSGMCHNFCLKCGIISLQNSAVIDQAKPKNLSDKKMIALKAKAVTVLRNVFA